MIPPHRPPRLPPLACPFSATTHASRQVASLQLGSHALAVEASRQTWLSGNEFILLLLCTSHFSVVTHHKPVSLEVVAKQACTSEEVVHFPHKEWMKDRGREFDVTEVSWACKVR